MVSRDPHEENRTATTLELLYDLTVVVAFSASAAQLAHLLAEGHVVAGLLTFGFAMFAVIWAWISYSWFMSAYDTDDWFVRIATLVQMLGVCILTIGIAPLAHGLDTSGHLDNKVMVGGYVVMRLAMVALWLRAAASDPARRRLALSYAGSLLVAQAGWVLMALLPLSVGATSAVVAVLYVIELSGPYLTERTKGGSPWHPHHIAERYGLLVIIALGEVILGTVEAVETLVGGSGWTLDAAVLLAAGIALAFTLWWAYFTIPFGDILHASRSGSFLWGYSHIFLFASVAAVGAGLHLVALTFAHESVLSSTAVITTVVVPLALFIGVFIASTLRILPSGHSLHAWLALGSAVILALAVGLAAWGAPVTVCLVVAVLAPILWVVAYEIVGHQHVADALDELEGER
jgi:low temperature requirement protein LtrA